MVPSGNGELITALLNSIAVNFWFRESFAMTHMQGGALPINADDLKKIPVPVLLGSKYEKVKELAMQACATKGDNAVVKKLEEAIFDWYGLDEKDRKTILEATSI